MPVKQTFFKDQYPLMFGFAFGISQQRCGPVMLVVTIGRWSWKWRIKEAKINAPE